MRYAALLFAVVAFPLQAFAIQVIPPHPTGADTVILLVSSCPPVNLTRIGNLFRLDPVEGLGCLLTPLPPVQIVLGQLAPGTYTYAFYESNVVVESGSFTVAPSVPALSPWALVVLGLALPVVGYVAIRRYSFL